MLLQPGDIAIDYSFARPAPAAIAATGCRMVCRYISPNRAHKKNLTAAERDALLEADLSLLLVWENATTDPLKGASLGAVHGKLAGDFARDLGYPAEMPLIVAVDFDAQPAQFETILDYHVAFEANAGFAIGTYGKAAIVSFLALRGVTVFGWQTVAWSHKVVSPQAHCLQHATPVHPTVPPLGAVDDNTVLQAFAAWSMAPDVFEPETGPTPAPSPTPKDPDMALIITNTDKHAGHDVGAQRWLMMDDGTKRELDFVEAAVRGNTIPEGVANAQLDLIPDWTPGGVSAGPLHLEGTFTGTATPGGG